MYQDIEQLFAEANNSSKSNNSFSNEYNYNDQSNQTVKETPKEPNIDNFLGNQNIVEQQMNSFSDNSSLSSNVFSKNDNKNQTEEKNQKQILKI